MQYQYKFSVVAPVYNVEKYLEEAFDSVINQTIGFKENIQLIIINDGSPDNSGAICEKYQKRYPENIVYKVIPNGGVSNARNEAFQYVEGKYIAFLDTDDKFALDAFAPVWDFFEAHDEVDVVAARMQFFEAKEDFHPLDYKFNEGTRVINIDDEKDYFSVQTHVSSAYMRTDALGDIRYDTGLKFGEDCLFITKIIAKKRAYGAVAESLYYYRKRLDESSAVQTQYFDKSFYTNTARRYYLEIEDYSKKLYGEVIPYIQSIVYYDIGWRIIRNEYKEVLSEEEQKEYLEVLHQALTEVDDRFIVMSKVHRGVNRKSAALQLKNGTDFFDEIVYDNETNQFKYKDCTIFKISRNKSRCTNVVNAEIKNGVIIIDMLVAKWLFKCTTEEVKLLFRFGKKFIAPELSDYKIRTVTYFDHEDYYYSLAHCEYPVSQLKKGETLNIKPYLVIGEEQCSLSINYGKFVANNNEMNGAYKFYGDLALRCFRTVMKVTYPENKKKTVKEWDKSIQEWLLEKGLSDVAQMRKKLAKFRKKQRRKGKIWLISDRIDNAGDNGEVFFKYVCEHKPKDIRPMFVIGSIAKPEVKKRLEAIGEVLYTEDKEYPYYFLLADKIISSSGGEFTINPFEANRPYFTDLMHFKYYFMNHGVNCGDCSKWLNRFNKNIHIFFTTGESERQNIIDRDYNLSPEQVVITGLARFDALYDDPKKQLLVLPTWRRAYKECYDDKTSSIYYEGFKETDFFKFYNGLINDERLLEVMRRKGYSGLFCLHPIFAKQSSHFGENDVFRINEGFVDYNKAFAESTVMVTDYSTIAFDFAYLNKPIVYTQFDKEEFYENQIYDECFDYEKEGFGPVCKDLDSAVNTLIEIIENDGENKYIDRVDHFFVNHDRNNAKRILESVLEDDRKDA